MGGPGSSRLVVTGEGAKATCFRWLFSFQDFRLNRRDAKEAQSSQRSKTTYLPAVDRGTKKTWFFEFS